MQNAGDPHQGSRARALVGSFQPNHFHSASPTGDGKKRERIPHAPPHLSYLSSPRGEAPPENLHFGRETYSLCSRSPKSSPHRSTVGFDSQESLVLVRFARDCCQRSPGFLWNRGAPKSLCLAPSAVLPREPSGRLRSPSFSRAF